MQRTAVNAALRAGKGGVGDSRLHGSFPKGRLIRVQPCSVREVVIAHVYG